MSKKREKRNELIVNKFKYDLKRIVDIAKEFNLTSQRIKQIILANLTKEEIEQINILRQIKTATEAVVKRKKRYQAKKLNK